MTKVDDGIAPLRGIDTLAKILIMSTDNAHSAALASQCREARFYVHEADAFSTFFAALRIEEFDLAIVDGIPGDFSGHEFSAQMGAYSYFPCLFLTNDCDERLFGEALIAGAYSYLVKPIEPERLLFVVRAALRNAQALQAKRHSSAGRGAPTEDQSRSINVVTGLLMERFSLSQQDAFERLRHYSRSKRAKIADVAHVILTSSDNTNQLLSSVTAGMDGAVEHRGRAGGASHLKKTVAYKPS